MDQYYMFPVWNRWSSLRNVKKLKTSEVQQFKLLKDDTNTTFLFVKKVLPPALYWSSKLLNDYNILYKNLTQGIIEFPGYGFYTCLYILLHCETADRDYDTEVQIPVAM